MDNQRTLTQNRALHKYFTLVAQEARNNGVSVKMMLDRMPDADIPLTPQIIKEIWKLFQNNILGKNHTAELTTKEIDEVFEPFSKFLAENYDIVLPFPSFEALMLNDLIERIENKI